MLMAVREKILPPPLRPGGQQHILFRKRGTSCLLVLGRYSHLCTHVVGGKKSSPSADARCLDVCGGENTYFIHPGVRTANRIILFRNLVMPIFWHMHAEPFTFEAAS